MTTYNLTSRDIAFISDEIVSNDCMTPEDINDLIKGQSREHLSSNDYWESVNLIVDCIVEEYEKDDHIHDLVHENVDASRWVFIVPQALKTIRYSDSDPIDDLWDNADTWTETVTSIAYQMMEQDVIDRLRRDTDIDV